MKSIRLSKCYSDKWRLKGYENYSITSCGKVINIKRNKELKKCLKGYTLGYNIGGKFMTLKTINSLAYIPKKIEIPF